MTLREMRKQNKKTVAEVAKVLGVCVRTLLRYEQGERRLSLESVLTLSELYQDSAEDIIKAQLKSVKK